MVYESIRYRIEPERVKATTRDQKCGGGGLLRGPGHRAGARMREPREDLSVDLVDERTPAFRFSIQGASSTMFGTPVTHRRQNRSKRLPVAAQGIFHAMGNGHLIDLPVEDSFTLQFSQLLRQNLLRRAEESSQLAEVPRPEGEVVEDLRFPFGSDHFDRRPDRAVRESHSFHRGLQLVSRRCLGFEKVPTGNGEG